MNLLSIQDNLKGVSDQDLARMMQSPDSTAPSYLVLSEIRRRKDMRTRAGDMPERTVAEDLVEIPQTYSDREGIRSLRVPGYEEEQQVDDADTGAGIEAMRAGGMVRMAEGGEVYGPASPFDPNIPVNYEQFGPPTPARRRPVADSAPANAAPRVADINMQDIMQRNMGLIPGIPEELMNRLREGRTNEPERRREAQSNALVEAGLRIAASNNPRLAGAIGEGALPAVQGYTQQRAQIRQDQRAELQQEMAAAQADIQRRYMAGQLSVAEYRSAMDMVGRREIAEMQIAAQRAQAGASRGAEDARLTRQLEAQREAALGRGEVTPQQYARMSDAEKAAFNEIQNIRRPQRADVAGMDSALAVGDRRLRQLGEQLNNHNLSKPGRSATPEALTAWRNQEARILGDIRTTQGYVDSLFGSIMGGGRQGTGTANPTAPADRPPLSSFVR